MRYYAMGNSYMSSIQQGIQAFHCVVDMGLMWSNDEMYRTWAKNHKTVICLNGGNNAKLISTWTLISSNDNPGYPVAKFREDDVSMGGMLTSIGIILPEKIYNANLEEPDGTLTPWEFEVATLLRRMPTAR